AALEGIGGFSAIAGEVIDDVNLALAVKKVGGPIRLSVSRSDVISVREYGTIGPIWRMVRRSAFDQLGYSWLLLAGRVAGLGLLFRAPPGVRAFGAAGAGAGGWRAPLAGIGAAGWGVMTLVFLPTVTLLGVRALWALSLPLGGLL